MNSRRHFLWFPLVALLSLSTATAQEDKKAAPPEGDALKKAEKLVKEVFKEDYANTSAQNRALLARKLIQQGIETRDDPASRFVLFREARDIAAAAGDLETALQAIRELAGTFDIDDKSMRNTVLTAAGKSARSPEEFRKVADQLLKLAEDAVVREDFDLAVQSAGSAAGLARKSRDLPLAARADAREKEISDLRLRSDKVKAAKGKLLVQADDPEANLILGQYLCMDRGEWETGLPLLAKSGHPALRNAAARELAKPTAPAEQLAAGDAWWDAGEKETGGARKALWQRAIRWYEPALPELSGLAKAKVEKRLTAASLEGIRAAWVDLTDAKRFGLAGNPGEAIVVAPEAGKIRVARLVAFPAGDHDGVTARIRFGANREAHGVLVFEKDGRCVLVDGPSGQVAFEHFEGKWIRDAQGDCGIRDAYLITITLEDGSYVVAVDGKEKFRIKTPAKGISFLALKADLGSVSFEDIRIRRTGLK